MLLSKAADPSCGGSFLRATKRGLLTITSSSNPRPIRAHAPATTHELIIARSHRGYATVSDGDRPPDLAERLAAWPKTPKPTPYEIFNQAAGEPYSKKRFYELVKLYHPDRYGHHGEVTKHGATSGSGGLPRAVKLERYRLVVAANGILCDPAKRRDYDACGAGWGEDAAAATRHMHTSWSSARYKAWRADPDSAANNATWEDWERWYQRQNGGAGKGEKQVPIFMSNGGFVIVICAFAVVGIWAQAAQATTRSANMIQARDQTHQMISRDMGYRRIEQATLSKEARVQYFLKQREGWGYDGYPEHQGHLPSGSPKS